MRQRLRVDLRERFERVRNDDISTKEVGDDGEEGVKVGALGEAGKVIMIDGIGNRRLVLEEGSINGGDQAIELSYSILRSSVLVGRDKLEKEQLVVPPKFGHLLEKQSDLSTRGMIGDWISPVHHDTLQDSLWYASVTPAGGSSTDNTATRGSRAW